MKGWLLEGTGKPDQTGKLIFRPAFIDAAFPLFLMGGSAIWWRYCRRFFVHRHVPGFVTPFTTLWLRGEMWQSMVERQHSDFTVVFIRLSASFFLPPLRHSSFARLSYHFVNFVALLTGDFFAHCKRDRVLKQSLNVVVSERRGDLNEQNLTRKISS